MQRWNLCAITILAASIAACGGGAAGNSTGPSTTTGGNTGGNTGGSNSNQVTLADQSFSPPTLTVAVGSTVTWAWPTCDPTGGGYGGYGSCVTHSVVFDDGSGVSSAEQSQGTFARTFTAAGTFKYHCGVHGQAMNGQVVVQ